MVRKIGAVSKLQARYMNKDVLKRLKACGKEAEAYEFCLKKESFDEKYKS